jgi:hypothetical protein
MDSIIETNKIASCYNLRTMAEAIFQEIQLYCPVCDANFTQLVVLHKLPKGFKTDSYLADMVERHNHQAFQAARKQAKSVDAGDQDAK